MSAVSSCRICGGHLHEFFEFGRQPLANALISPGHDGEELLFRLAVGICRSCTMVQLTDEVPRELMFHDAYPYRSSGSAFMRDHFESVAHEFLDTELKGNGFLIEIGCNDGVMLRTIAAAGMRHLGVDPSRGATEAARSQGMRVRNCFFDEASAAGILAEEGPANVIYSANTISHVPYVESIFNGVASLLAPGGIFVFEDPYFGDIVERTAFDQIYDEHFFLFTVRSVANLAERSGMQLVDVAHLPVHGGEIRFTLSLRGAREPTARVAEMLRAEDARGLTDLATLQRFSMAVQNSRRALLALLRDLRGRGKRVVGYGATAKSATVTNYCGIGPDLLPFIVDNTPAKQGRLTPGSHIPIRPPEAFSRPYPEFAVLFAWNHAREIMEKEREFRKTGGRWILYVPQVHVV